MKKIFTLAAIAVASFTANAQTVNSSKLLDNWSIGLSGGAYTPTTHHAFWGSMRPCFALEIGKELTPIFGVGVEGSAFINNNFWKSSPTAIDASTVVLLGKVNLTNLLCGGYKGEPRFFEVVARAGLGWAHAYYPKSIHTDYNTWGAKLGLAFNFNLGKDKAWQINLKPSIYYNLENAQAETNSSLNYFDISNSRLEFMAGVTYKFKNSNGTHNFTLAKLYDKAEVDGLNARINDLRSQLTAKDGQSSQNQQTIRTLQQQLNDCRNQAPQTVTKATNSMESVVTFGQGKTAIEKSQLPNVERIATYMKNHKNSKVVIKGYASPEGSAEINAKIATARAEAVKSILVNKYKIAADRITSEGQGVGNMFSENDWNRVAISTLDDNK